MQMELNISENASLLEESMMQELGNSSALSSEYTICMVPERLRHVKRTMYTPKVVSIGPYHHHREELKAMEEYKKMCLNYFLRVTSKRLGFYIQVVQREEQKLRDCYAGGILLESDDFVKIILADAVFIIVFLLHLKFGMMVDKGDRVFGSASISQDIWFDMLLLENQIPFFILVDLFNSALEAPSISGDIFDLSNNCFKELMHLEVREETLERIRSSNIQHFVDFLRRLHSPIIGQGTGELQPTTSRSINLSLLLRTEARVESRTVTIPSITQLHKAGVRIEVREGTNLFDLQFDNGILEFPKFVIGKESEIATRNMLVYEKCCRASNYISVSIVLINKLIQTEKDVDLLVKFGILENRLGDTGKVLLLIKELADETFLDWKFFSFADLCENLNTYCRRSSRRWRERWYDWKENPIETYFKTPWSGISVIAGVALLTLTVVQTVYAILSYRPSLAFEE